MACNQNASAAGRTTKPELERAPYQTPRERREFLERDAARLERFVERVRRIMRSQSNYALELALRDLELDRVREEP